MLSPQKILILVIILGVVWFLFRTLERRGKVMMDENKESQKNSTLDLQQCSACDAWVDSPCGKKDCPISG